MAGSDQQLCVAQFLLFCSRQPVVEKADCSTPGFIKSSLKVIKVAIATLLLMALGLFLPAIIALIILDKFDQ